MHKHPPIHALRAHRIRPQTEGERLKNPSRTVKQRVREELFAVGGLVDDAHRRKAPALPLQSGSFVNDLPPRASGVFSSREGSRRV